MNDATTNKAIMPTARSKLYRFLALGFEYPDASQLAQMKAELSPLERCLELLGDDEGLKLFDRLRTLLETTTTDDLETSFIGSFGHTSSKDSPPYETEYGQTHIFRKSQSLADIAGFYRAFGLQLTADCHERLDHICVELEFMAFLCQKKAYALASGLPETQLALCEDAEKKFLREHLGRWGPLFARKFMLKAGDSFYGLLARLLSSTLCRELQAFAIKPNEIAIKPGEIIATDAPQPSRLFEEPLSPFEEPFSPLKEQCPSSGCPMDVQQDGRSTR